MDGSPLRITLIFLLFAAQHSLSVSHGWKTFLIRRMGSRAFEGRFRLLFTLWNLLLFTLCLLYWRSLPDQTLFAPSSALTWSLHGMQIVGLWVLFQAGRAIDLLHFIGIRQWRRLRCEEPFPSEELITTCIYRKIRHPIYTGSILILWGEVHLLKTVNGLLLVLLATVYFVIGSMMEERRMIRQFGEHYLEYRKKTGRFLPRCKNLSP